MRNLIWIILALGILAGAYVLFTGKSANEILSHDRQIEQAA